MSFRREIKWEPGFDHRNDPKKKQYGCHGLQIRFLLHGEHATVQFLLMTPWLPTWERLSKINTIFDVLPADLGYHADIPQYENQTLTDKCDCRPSGKCYYDGSGLNADETFRLLVTKGEEAVWKHMDDYYHSLITQPSKAKEMR